MTGSRIPTDALVRGRVGSLERIATGRVFSVSPYGYVAAMCDGNQTILHDVEVLEGPRPEKERRDIPAHLAGRS